MLAGACVRTVLRTSSNPSFRFTGSVKPLQLPPNLFARTTQQYPELDYCRRCRLVVFRLEVGGRWTEEAATFIRLLAPAAVRTQAARVMRWSRLIASSPSRRSACSLPPPPLQSELGAAGLPPNIPQPCTSSWPTLAQEAPQAGASSVIRCRSLQVAPGPGPFLIYSRKKPTTKKETLSGVCPFPLPPSSNRCSSAAWLPYAHRGEGPRPRARSRTTMSHVRPCSWCTSCNAKMNMSTLAKMLLVRSQPTSATGLD